MVAIRHAGERGRANFGWLDSRHTFSFGSYYDPAFMGFGPLRVINEDEVIPGHGFDTHGHQDMEILSYVLDGALEHRDSMGNGSVIRPGDLQRMSAGTGVRHSEMNHSKSEPVHFLQIWIMPEERGMKPSYEQVHFPREVRLDQLALLGSGDGRDGSVRIHQDVDLYAGVLTPGSEVTHPLQRSRGAWVQVARGEVTVNGRTLKRGDGAAVVDAGTVVVESVGESEVLLFDMGGISGASQTNA